MSLIAFRKFSDRFVISSEGLVTSADYVVSKDSVKFERFNAYNIIGGVGNVNLITRFFEHLDAKLNPDSGMTERALLFYVGDFVKKYKEDYSFMNQNVYARFLLFDSRFGGHVYEFSINPGEPEQTVIGLIDPCNNLGAIGVGDDFAKGVMYATHLSPADAIRCTAKNYIAINENITTMELMLN